MAEAGQGTGGQQGVAARVTYPIPAATPWAVSPAQPSSGRAATPSVASPVAIAVVQAGPGRASRRATANSGTPMPKATKPAVIQAWSGAPSAARRLMASWVGS